MAAGANKYAQAPKLDNKGKPKIEGNFMQIEMSVFKKINEKVDARHSVARSLMILLVGTADGFGLSQKFVLDNLGCSEKRYYTARQYLCELNLINYDEEKNKITLNYDVLLDRHEVYPTKLEGRHEDNPKSRLQDSPLDRLQDCYNIEETEKETKNNGFSSNEEKPTAAPKQVGLAVEPLALSEKDKLNAKYMPRDDFEKLTEGVHYLRIDAQYIRSIATNNVFKLYVN